MKQPGITISLRFSHPSMDPDLISKALKIEPRQVFRADRDPAVRAKSSDPRTRQTYWTSEIVGLGEESLAESLQRWVSKLEPHKDFFQSVIDSGGRIEFFIGWFIKGNDGDVLPWRLLETISALHLDLSICLYPIQTTGSQDSDGAVSRLKKPS